MQWIRALPGALVSALLLSNPAAADWYSRGHGRAPAADTAYICHGYMCRIVTPVHLSGAELRQIAGALTGKPRDAAAERAALSRSVQAYERIVGRRAGTSGDLARMQFGEGADGQMDCVDEATNTTSLLRLLAAHGYLKHHTVLEPDMRGFFLDGRYPHATAVLAETKSGAKWVVDSWPRANAEPPVIEPLSEWKSARPGDLLPPA